MVNRTATVLSVALLVTAGAWLHVSRLDVVPAYVMHDEAQGALQAHAIATTGRDLTGRFLPLYFTEPEFLPGRDPVMIYTTALGLKVLPFTEAGVRTPTAVVAVLDAVLLFVVAQRLFGSTAVGLVAAALLLLTPVHFIRGRLLLSPLYTIPFILLWLWMLWRFHVRPTTARLAACAAVLGLGMYSYLAAVVMMPLYLLITWAIAIRRVPLRSLVISAAVFAGTLLPMLAWYVTHPERNMEIVSAYQLDAAAASPMGRWVGLYWSFFEPSFLFVSGDASLINSTRNAGFFPLAFAALIPIGLVALVRSRQAVPLAVAAGFIAAPLVTVISGSIEMNRVMFAIPFGALAAAYGAHVLLRSARRLAKMIGVLLLLSVPWQFAGMYSEYMGPYRFSSASWFSGRAREGVRALMNRAAGTTAPLYVSGEIDWVQRTWQFYAIADGRTELTERVVFVRATPTEAAPGSLLLVPSGSPMASAARQAGWLEVETAASIDGSQAFSILQRAGAAEAAR